MKNLWINKKAILSILLAGSITLCSQACGKSNDNKNDAKDINDTVSTDVMDNNSTEYIDKKGQVVDLTVLNNTEYTPAYGDNRYTLYTGASIYYKDGYNIIDEEITTDLFIVDVVESNDSYSLVLLPNGKTGYVNNNLLIKCANLTNSDYIMVEKYKEDILSTNAYLYNERGMYIDYVSENQTCNVVATNGEYTLITLPDGRQGYVLNRSLTYNHKQINGYGYIRSGKTVYSDTNLNSGENNIVNDQVVYVQYFNEKYAAISFDNSSEVVYVRTTDLDQDFIIIDLDSQQIYCYLDFLLAGSWGTRSGKDSTPTHAGAFDIDWKAEDWEFTNYPGSRAMYWIPINEFGEGIHDLVGDDEQNYGNEAYHQYGSHGCIRVPRAASEFVYENYEVGDMVLVRKK